jgi:hypothetical protein
MAKVYDYGAFTNSKTGFDKGSYNFTYRMKYVDIDVINKPEEYENISDSRIFIDYSVMLDIQKEGIMGLNFQINLVEFEFDVDDGVNPPKQFDIDFVPGKTIDIGQMHPRYNDDSIPTVPSRVKINMNNSTDPRKYDVDVNFG